VSAGQKESAFKERIGNFTERRSTKASPKPMEAEGVENPNVK